MGNNSENIYAELGPILIIWIYDTKLFQRQL